jgi:hypothetical protein
MASHDETWRPVPGSADDAVEEQPELDPNPAPVLERDSGTEGLPEPGSGVIEWMLSKVPDGPAKDVLAWVGDDRSRALAAQVVEQEKEAPRVTLIAALEKVSG